MRDLLDSLLNEDFTLVKQLMDEHLKNLVREKFNQVKMRLAAEMYELPEVGVELEEANVQRSGRTKLTRVRIRGGKIQRRIRSSAVSGYTMRGGRMTRMSALERRNRKMAARRSKFKRRAKLGQALRKRRMSLRKRKAMGVR
jgi:hypothetical protein